MTATAAPVVAAPVIAVRKRTWRAWLGAAAVVAAAGVWFGAVLPRGPMTASDVVWAVLLPLVAGGAAGALAGSRWAVAAAPVWFAAVTELVRAGDAGPSVDWPRLDSLMGVAVAVTSRGVQAWLILVPLMVGTAVGAGWYRRRHGVRRPGRAAAAGRFVGRAAVVTVSVLLIGTLVVLTRPGSTEPIVDAAGYPVPGSVSELARVTLGGQEQTVLIRGRSADAPVLLYLAGGPGQSDIGYARAYLGGLEDDVVLAVWDQRGTGTSYSALEPVDSWTRQQAVSDTVELATYLRDRFGGRKILVFGNSWGSVLGILAVQARPDLFAAYIGAGQMVNVAETDRRINVAMRELARSRGDQALLAEVESWGPVPYSDVYPYGRLIEFYDDLAPYRRTESFTANRPAGIDGNGAQEYGWLDSLNKLRAIADMGAALYPQIQDIDFRRDAAIVEVPVFIVAGRHELPARSDLAREWFDRLAAPSKRWIDFERSGHVPQFEESDRFEQVVRDVVIPAVVDGHR